MELRNDWAQAAQLGHFKFLILHPSPSYRPPAWLGFNFELSCGENYKIVSIPLSLLCLRNYTTFGVMHCHFVKRNFSSYHRHSDQLPSLSPHLLRCSLSTQAQQQAGEMPSITHYLISSFGISADWAMKVSTSKNLSCIKTPEQPDSVVSFLKEIGLSDSQIRSLVLFDPNLLTPSVDNIYRPWSRALLDTGFTEQMLAQSIQSNPLCLSRRDTLSWLHFWRDFVGDSEWVALESFTKEQVADLVWYW